MVLDIYAYAQLFGGDSPYEDDDREADKIYQAIDDRMDSRRKRRREEQLLETLKKARAERPKAGDQFTDLKADLKNVSMEEWMGIPDVGDQSLKFKQRKRQEVFTPAPDHLIESQRAALVDAAAPIDPRTGLQTPMSAGGSSSIAGLSQARETVLSIKLDKMSDSVSGQTVVDPKGYLTDLNSIKINTDTEVGDIKRARLLLVSLTDTNPKHAPGWVARARVEEQAGKIVAARKIIKEGCEACPESEDVWLEAARLYSAENARTILADAVRHLPQSVKVWLRAADLEPTEAGKKIVLRRALEYLPKSVKLWKTAISAEEEEDARIMLERAVECVPHSVDMWLALARLETYENAKNVLNRALKELPTEGAIWITAAKLEEAHQKGDNVEKIINMAISILRQQSVVLDREHWLREAEGAERAGSPLTGQAIVRATIYMGVEDEDRYRTWTDDADSALQRGAVETARAILAYALQTFPGKKALWSKACDLEKAYGTPEALEQMLKKAVTYCPQAESLWLRAAKEKWLLGDVPAARALLTEAFKANPDSEAIWLAAVKLEWENNEFERARILLSKARQRVPTQRVWLKSAKLERELGQITTELVLLEEAVKSFPDHAKFYMMAGQACDEALHEPERAREYYQKGLSRCPHSIPLWRLAGLFEERVHGFTKARSMFELARLRNPRNPELWLEAVRLERRAGNEKLAASLMAKGLQECPDSGLLWAEEIIHSPRPQQKSKSQEALSKCPNDPFVFVAVARLFEATRKYAKARKWFNQSVELNPDLGDSWAYYYAFELRHGSETDKSEVLKNCLEADPTHGEIWTAVSKSVENWRLSKESILKKVVAKLQESAVEETSEPIVKPEMEVRVKLEVKDRA
ncbi:pre-mrna-processing factor 6 [Nannochloropsis gaditana]|uniref:Pre-mrna-processing factor 6 n=1 Tax=Nannochloropsis gaditana TaxID=72520 RepID=W7TQ58_9STRA|nr:pre-mrna-processing factor 6 [Nannochloropsis gaditana]